MSTNERNAAREIAQLRTRVARLQVDAQRYAKLRRAPRSAADPKPVIAPEAFEMCDPRPAPKAGSRVLPALTPPLKLGREMAAAIVKELRAMTLEVRAAVKALAAEGGAAMDAAAMDDLPQSARRKIESLHARWKARFEFLAAEWSKHMITGVVAQSNAQLGMGLKDVADKMAIESTLSTRRMRAVVEAASLASTSLITRIPEKYLGEVQVAVMSAITTGTGLNKLVPFLTKKYKGDARHAQLTALDQVRKVTESVNATRLQSLGVEEYVWMHVGGERYPRKLHQRYHGRTFRYDDPPVIDKRTGERGKPGDAINCLLGNALVENAHGVHKFFRRRFTGHLAAIITEHGSVLEATPNHPVLTQDGWKPIQFVDVGEYVVKARAQSFHGSRIDVQWTPTSFSESFDSAALLIDGAWGTRRITSLDFHGDTTDGEVDVVSFDGMLPDEADAAFCEQLLQLALSWPDVDQALLRGDGASHAGLIRVLGAPSSLVRRCCALLSLLDGHARSAGEVREALSSWLYAGFKKARAQRFSGNTVLRCEREHADPFVVLNGDLSNGKLLAAWARAFDARNVVSIGADELAKIVRMHIDCGSGLFEAETGVKHLERIGQRFVRELADTHVYNLETRRNWYSSGSIIMHNCRCRARPVLNFAKGAE